MKRIAAALTLVVVLPTLTLRAQHALPGDIDPDSRSRLPLAKPGASEEAARPVSAGAAANFAGIQNMRAAVDRYGFRGDVAQAASPLGLGFMQFVILVTAREHDQPYEWSLHEMQAIAVGLDPAEIDVVRNRKPLAGLPEREALVLKMAHEIFAGHQLTSATFAEGLKIFGQKNFVDIIGLMANYSGTSATLSAFNQQMPPGWKQFLPLPFTPPDDIHADSRNRLPLVTDRVQPEPGFAKLLYGRGPEPLGTGPSQIALHAAAFPALLASVGRPLIDLAILVTAREHDSQYDWTMNELAAVNEGLDPEIIDVVRYRKPTAGLPENDAAVIEFARELFRAHYVTSPTYSHAIKAFGEGNLVALVRVLSQHTQESALLAAFDLRLPAGQNPLLP
jgi:4-carboxymuconolactone decarboxylase